MTARVAVLLATYNGENFLRAQLDSLLAQSWRDFEVLARDDRSQDASLAIVREYAARDSRFKIVDGVAANVGVVRSFGMLLGAAVGYEYVFFCDQDDVWHPQKIERMVGALEKIEAAAGPHVPAAVHCDLSLIAADGKPLAPSMRARTGLPTSVASIWPLLARNFVTGCALGINRALTRACLPVAKDALMHDWWIALAAQAFGRLEPIDEPLVAYRQHSRNASGAMAEFGLWNKLRRGIATPSRFRTLLMRRFRQSLALEQHLRVAGRTDLANELRDYHRATSAGRLSALAERRRRGIQLFDRKRTLFYDILLLIYQPRVRRLISLQNSLQRSS